MKRNRIILNPFFLIKRNFSLLLDLNMKNIKNYWWGCQMMMAVKNNKFVHFLQPIKLLYSIWRLFAYFFYCSSKFYFGSQNKILFTKIGELLFFLVSRWIFYFLTIEKELFLVYDFWAIYILLRIVEKEKFSVL